MYLVMTEIFEDIFHKKYVGGVGEVREKPVQVSDLVLRGQTPEDVLAEYRWYMRDANAQLPEVILEELRTQGKI